MATSMIPIRAAIPSDLAAVQEFGERVVVPYYEALGLGAFARALIIVSQFTGVNLVVTMSSGGDATFVDVLRVNDAGQIVEHLEVTPQATAIR